MRQPATQSLLFVDRVWREFREIVDRDRKAGSRRGNKVHEVHRVFEAILNEVDKPLRASIRRQVAGTCIASEADDIAQAVFMLIWMQLKSGSLKGLTLENWRESKNLYRIRTTAFRNAKFVRYRIFRRTNRLLTNIDDFSSQCIHEHEMQLFENDIRSALKNCAKEIQDAFFLRLDGLSYREIAEHQGVSESVARLRHFRARAVLKAWLEDIE